MLRLRDSRNFGRTLAGIGLIAGPTLFLIATLVSPAWSDDTAAYLEEVADNEAAHVVSGLIFLLGALLLIAGMFGVIRLFRERRVNLGQIAAGMIIIGVIASTSFYAIGVTEIAMVDSAADRDEMVALSERAEESAGAVVIILLFLIGIVLGSLLLAFALWRRRVVPPWVPAVLVVSTVLSFFSSSQVMAAISFALLAAAFGAIGLRILSLSDEEWERWELPPRGAGTSGPSPATVEPAA